MTEKNFDVCCDCDQPTVEEVDHDPRAEDETVYYCSTCGGGMKEGSPKRRTYTLTATGDD